MAQQENKTKLTDQDAAAFVASIGDEQRRRDCETLLHMMSEITGEPPKMWGSSIVGFGQYHYKYESGREGDFLAVGFSPRKASLTLYLLEGFSGHRELLEKLGPHTTGKSCLYIKRLQDVDLDILRKLIQQSYTYTMAHSNAMHRAD